jgi:long-chain acyl-CoA synthetase
MKHTIFLTGATGFIGTHILKELVKNTSHTIIVLVRAANSKQARIRLYRAFWEHKDLCTALDNDRIKVMVGDVTQAMLGLDKKEYDSLRLSISHIIHSAADLRLRAPLSQLRKTNVEGTRQVLELACLVHKAKRLKRFSYISTAYVAGDRQGIAAEDSLLRPRSFLSNYEQSKFEAEELVLKQREVLPLSIFRPAMVVGDSASGYIKTFNTIYALLKLYFTRKVPFIPLNPGLRVNLIPVDYVAMAAAGLTFDPEAHGHTFHLTAPRAALPTIKELVEFVREWALTSCFVRLSYPVFLSLPFWLLKPGLALLNLILLKRNRSIKNLATLAPYYYEKRTYNRSNLDRLLGRYKLAWKDYLPRSLAFAVDKGFLHRKAFTVQEQLLYRLGKTYLPIAYHEIRNRRILSPGNKKLRQEISSACLALKALGIRKGDYAGIAGHNSLKYLILDTALGLCEAVNIPLSVNIPLPELRALLGKINFRLLFTDSGEHLQLAPEFKQKPVFIFLTDLPLTSPHSTGAVLSWDSFLSRANKVQGRQPGKFAQAELTFDDPATIRFTSGTTGALKQVPFYHRQLRWMAETLNSLFPWKYRLKPVRYLSFLPMNHVVGGILALYAPYFALAKVDVYFLPDFDELVPALKKVKPVIFFCVPRFYEKVYEALAQNRVYRLFTQTGEGLAKRLLRYFLRRVVLRRTGLKHCKQLISGSAPLSTSLARRFRELGLEIHNAYGLSEAPLLTINRYAHNSLGTVGTPLPETEIKIAPDGEILARGPQVSPDCLSRAPHAGFLCTGDLGQINTKGELTINGRKKEILVTAYGKNIHPLRLENLLKEITGVKEAVVIGEGRPYISALLWADAEQVPPGSQVSEAMARLNLRLSPPERIKRFALLPYDLSVNQGDFTATYKLVREAINRRFKKIIDALYNGSSSIPDKNFIYLGEIQENP